MTLVNSERVLQKPSQEWALVLTIQQIGSQPATIH